MNTLIKRKEFSGKVNTSCYIPALADQKDKKFFLLGLGNTSDKFKDDDASKLITKICTLAKTANTKKVSFSKSSYLKNFNGISLLFFQD